MRFSLFALLLSVGSACAAPMQLLSPADGEVVSQLNDVQMRFVHESMVEREKYFDGGANAAVLKKAKSSPKPVVLHWKGGQAPYRVTVKRQPDGKVFFSETVQGHHARVDSLEIARSWSVEIGDATSSIVSSFRTEDQTPRLIKIHGVPNARDLGGRIGMDGRRIRQGLLFRTAGLNDNAPIDYYSLAEITAFHKEGKLAKMGAVGKNHARQLDCGEKLKESDMRLVKRSCYAPGKERLTAEERARLKALYGFRTDIDLRGAKEVYGMTGSPLGPDVKWENVELVGGYGSFDKEEYFDCKRKIFRVIFDPKAYPIVFHCIGGADRTGTIAFMIEALLGVDENQLALDYLTTGLAAGVTDPKHKGWFDSMMKTYRALPGASPQEKMNGVFLKMGFTQREIDGFREFMLEPKPEKTDANAASAAVFVPGKHGALDGRLEFTENGRRVRCCGFDVQIDGKIIWRGNGWPLKDFTAEQDGRGNWTVTHFVDLDGRTIPVEARITFVDDVCRVSWSMPGVVRNARGEPRFTQLNPGWWDVPIRRMYFGFGVVAENPVEYRTGGSGASLSNRHVGADFENGVSILQATDVFPLHFVQHRERKRFQLETQHDATYTFVRSSRGAFAAAKRFAAVSGYVKGPGVDKVLGRQCLDRWGGNSYDFDATNLNALVAKGVTDAFYLKHVWQHHGYDVQLPDIWPPRGDRAKFDALVAAAKAAKIPFGLHDNYIDLYTNATGFAWDLVARDAKGDVQKAFYNPLSKQQSFRIQPRKIFPFLRRNMKLMREGCSPEALFIDVFTSAVPFDYYDEEGAFHPSTESAADWRRAFDEARTALGRPDLIAVSEAGHDWLIGHVDAVECDHYPPQRLMKSGSFSDGVRVPWADMVVHGRMVMLGGGLGQRYCAPGWRMKGDDLRHGYATDDYFCTTLIGGRNPMSDAVADGRPERTYRQLHDVCKELAKGEFELFEFVGDDIRRQHAVFSTGEVWVNVSSNVSWTVEGRTLPPYGYLAVTESGRQTTNADRPLVAAPFEKGEFGFWRMKFADGTFLNAAECSCRTETAKDGGRRYVYHAPEARVEVRERQTSEGTVFDADVSVRGSRTMVEFELPARMRFATNIVERVVAPVGDTEGFGLALNAGFFARQLAHRKNYPTAFADYLHLKSTRGDVALYGVRPRPPHEPWKCPKPFVPGRLGCGADKDGGWMEYAFTTWVKEGETWRSPSVVLANKDYETSLADYAHANTLTRTIDEKMPKPLQEKLKVALQLVVPYNESAVGIRSMLDFLPPGTHIRSYGYMHGGFDRQYPDYLPPRQKFGTADGLKDLVKAVHAKGMTISLYTNPTLLCDNPRGPTFEAIGDAACAVREDGKAYYEKYGTCGGFAATMWHPNLIAATEKVRRTFADEYGLDLLFEDQHGARKFKYDFNPCAPSPTAFTEGILSSCEDGMRVLPLGTENGWDQVANTMCMLEGLSFAMYPAEKPRPYGTLLKRRKQYPPETWEIEPLVQRLFHDKCFFKHHDAAQYVTNDRTLAWSLAFGYSIHVGGFSSQDLANDPAKRAWLARLAQVQREVVSRYALRTLVAFRHDRSFVFAAGADPMSPDDDGVIDATYEGGLRLVVNLGPVARTYDGIVLKPYGWFCGEAKAASDAEGTLRDDCWMWGHDPGVYDGKNNRNNIPLSAKVSIPDAIRYMGIPNVSVIRWKPAEPGDAYVESYRDVKRVSWAVCGRLKDYETLHAQAFRLIGAMPNLVGLDLDDYFKSGDKSETVETEAGPVSVTRSRIGHKALLALRKELDALPRHIDLRMTVYADKLRDDDAPALALADTVLFWTWNGKNIAKLRENFAKYRTLAPTKRTLLGIYMWDFGAHAPIGMDYMRAQLDIAHELYMNHEIDGLVFHCTPLVNKGLEAVEYARAWLARHGDERRPNQR